LLLCSQAMMKQNLLALAWLAHFRILYPLICNERAELTNLDNADPCTRRCR
jgi:hypothetical protein